MSDTTPTSNLDKTFSPADIEARLYDGWEKGGYFKPGR